MLDSSEPTDKAMLLATIQTGYARFEDLLHTLKEEQMVLPGVNGSWSVKDNIIHLTIWQNYQAARLEGILEGGEPPDPVSGVETVDEENEYFYHQYKDYPLEEALADFRAAYQRILTATQALSWEVLNKPFPWYDNNVPVSAYTLGNTSEHYEEHGELIQHWLEVQK